MLTTTPATNSSHIWTTPERLSVAVRSPSSHSIIAMAARMRNPTTIAGGWASATAMAVSSDSPGTSSPAVINPSMTPKTPPMTREIHASNSPSLATVRGTERWLRNIHTRNHTMTTSKTVPTMGRWTRSPGMTSPTKNAAT